VADTLLTTFFARCANSSVLLLSSKCAAARVIMQMMAVRALPPKAGWRMRVRFESLYGMCLPARCAASSGTAALLTTNDVLGNRQASRVYA
jgi:hypothetical protein